jgi:hypothetical protein
MTGFLKFFGVFLAIIAVISLGRPFQTDAAAQRSVKNNFETNRNAPAISNSLNEDSLILLNSAAIDVRSAEAKAARKLVGGFDGKRMHLVRFRGPIRPEWHKMLSARGLEIVDYIPNYTYIVYGDASTINSLQSASMEANSPIEWDGGYKDEYRISPDVFAAKGKNGVTGIASDLFQVQLYNDPSANADTFALIDSFKNRADQRPAGDHALRQPCRRPRCGRLQKLASRPDVISIHGYSEPVKLDERQDIILAGNLTGSVPTPGDYLAYLAGKGFTQAQFDASNFAVDISDSGVDTATPQSPNEFVFRRLGDPAGTSRYNLFEDRGYRDTGRHASGLRRPWKSECFDHHGLCPKRRAVQCVSARGCILVQIRIRCCAVR